MSSPKTAIVAGAAIAAITALPLFQGESEAKALREQISTLNERRTAAEAAIGRHEAEAAAASDAAAAAQSTRTVRELIEHSEKGVDIDEMMESIMQVMMSQDMISMLKLFLPLANLDREEYNQLLEDLEAYKGNAQTKMVVIQMMSMFAPADNPSEALERLVKLGVAPYSYANLLNQWAADNPDAALSWYRTKLAEGALDGKGIHSRPEQYLLAQLISGVAKNAPGRGVDLLVESVNPGDSHAHNAVHQLAGSLGENIRAGGGDAELRRLLEWDTEGSFRQQIVASAMRAALRESDFREVTRFAETYHDDPGEQQEAVIDYVRSQQDQPIAERAEQLLGYLPEERAPGAIRELVDRGASSNVIDPETVAWVAAQPAGPVRDAGYQGLANNHMMLGQYEDALQAANQIADPMQRETATFNAAEQWWDSDEEAARESLPAELVDRVEDGRAEDMIRLRTIYSTGPDGETVVTEEVIESAE